MCVCVCVNECLWRARQQHSVGKGEILTIVNFDEMLSGLREREREREREEEREREREAESSLFSTNGLQLNLAPYCSSSWRPWTFPGPMAAQGFEHVTSTPCSHCGYE